MRVRADVEAGSCAGVEVVAEVDGGGRCAGGARELSSEDDAGEERGSVAFLVTGGEEGRLLADAASADDEAELGVAGRAAYK